jgi:hypothetical protein
VFEENDYFTGPPLTDESIRLAETELGYRLPDSYKSLLRQRNGGVPTRRCIRTTFRTSWAPDHFRIDAILGLGGAWGLDSVPGGSAYMIEEWGYPAIGLVICTTPSAGHDTVMLDYRSCGPEGEPAVAYIDEGSPPQVIAANFSEFLDLLEPCTAFRDDA